MGYQRKALEATDRRLEWFKNDKYAGLGKLTYLGWYFQVLVRRNLLKRLDSCGGYTGPVPDALAQEIQCVRATPVVTLGSIKTSRLELSRFHYLAVFLARDGSTGKYVTPLVFSEMIDYVDQLLIEAESRYSIAAKEEYERVWGPARLRLIERGFNRRATLKSKFGQSPLELFFPGWSSEIVQLDLRAQDRVLRADFEALLRQLRKNRPIEVNKRPYPELDLRLARTNSRSKEPQMLIPQKLLDQKLIQFVDLLIWEKQFRIKIPLGVKESLLFASVPIQRKKRRLLGSASTRSSGYESKKIGNRYTPIRNSALALMNPDHAANIELETSARLELEQAYSNAQVGVGLGRNSEFVPSEAELLTLRHQL
jgi:hypothetical protein